MPVQFNTYEDMEKAVANRRLISDEMSREDMDTEQFIDAMMDMFKRELESATSDAYDKGCDDGYETGEHYGYDAGWQNGHDAAQVDAA